MSPKIWVHLALFKVEELLDFFIKVLKNDIIVSVNV